ncbi:MAG: light-harvesting antenna LH1, beta subunit [Myxococcota bacterium]
MADSKESATGLTEEEAKEFHSGIIKGTIGYLFFAVVAHYLMWIYKPWFHPNENIGELMDAGQTLATTLMG